MDDPARIEQYDLASRQWLPSITLSSTHGTLTAGWVDGDGIYAAYGTSAYRYDLSGNAEAHLTDAAQNISQIFSDGNILFLNRSGSLYARFTSINKDSNTVVADFSNYIDALVGASIAPSVNKLFGRSSGISPADITYVNYNDDGTFGSGGDSPYHGSYPGGNKTWVFPGDGKVVDNSGTIYSTAGLSYMKSFGSGITDLAFYGNEVPILLSGSKLTAYTTTILPTGSTTLDHAPNRIFIDDEHILTFTVSASSHGLTVRSVPISTLNPPTPGEPIDPTGLAYTPNSSFIDKNGVLCLFSKANQSIFRWDTFMQQYTNTVPLVGVPDYVAYSADNHTVYLAYSSGLIRQIDLDDPDYAEVPFANLSGKPGGLATAGSYVFAVDPSGAWVSHYTYMPDGTLIEAVDWNYYSKEYIWNAANQKMYFFRDDTSPNDLLWEQINADGITYPSEPAGGIGTKKDSPLHTSSGFTHPIRVAPNGSIVVLGSGVIHDAITLARLPDALTNSVQDIAWIGDDIYTTRTIDGTTQYQQWLYPSFGSGNVGQGPGTANRLIALDEEKLVSISIDAGGVPVINVLNTNFEETAVGLGRLSIEVTDVTEGDGLLINGALLTVSSIPASNLVVNLSVDEGGKISVPDQAVIPAGQTNVYFDLTALDDTLLDGSSITTIRASSYRYEEGVSEVWVHDNETATLTLSLPQTTYEGAGTIAGAIIVSAAPDADVKVELVSNNTNKIASASVVIPAGQIFAPFTLNVLDDSILDGVQTATIEARVQNWTGSHAAVFIFDDETNGIDLQLPASVVESDGVLVGAATVSLPGTVQVDTHVVLSSPDSSELTVPFYVTIPAGQSSVTFDITVIDDSETDGQQRVAVLAESPGYIPDSKFVSVLDDDAHHLQINGVSSDPAVLETVSINISAKTIDDMSASAFSGPVSLSATGDNGSVAVSPSVISNFANGSASAEIAFGGFANNVTLTVDGGAGLTATSGVFNVLGSRINITPVALTNTQVVAGESATRTLVISNSGNADLEFEIKGAASDEDNDVPTEGLVAYYPFNGDAADESGNGHDGTVNGARLTADRFGNAGSAYLFDGVNDYIDLGTMGGFKTVSMWIRQEARSDYDFYFGHTNFRLYAADINSGELSLGDGTGALGGSPHMDNETGKWNHVVAISDGINSTLYFNGTNATAAFRVLAPVGSAAVNLGRWTGGTHYFHGAMDDVRVYDRVLSDAEIVELYNETDGDTGLLASYPLNGNADDESGNGHDGTVNGATLTTDRFGNSDSAYDFDGVNDYIETDNSLGTASTPFTVSAWMNSSNARYQILVSKKPTGIWLPGQWQLFVQADQVSFGFCDGIDNLKQAVANLNVHDGSWHHVCGVLETNRSLLYVDGVVVATNTAAKLAGQYNIPIRIGDRVNSGGRQFFDGLLDDVRIYDRALSADDIVALYNSEIPVEPPPAISWLSVYPASGTIAPGESVTVDLIFDASDMKAGDQTNATLTITCNDVLSPTNDVTVSMQAVNSVAPAGDAIADAWKKLYFGEPAAFSPLLDADGDGLNNWSEYIAGTDPTDAGSSLNVRCATANHDDSFVVTWDAVTGRVYSVWWQNGLGREFQPLETGIQYPQNSYTDTVHSVEGCGFYKVTVELAPETSSQ